MKEILEQLYNLNIESIAKISDKVYRITAKNKQYILKYHESNDLEEVFERINVLNLTTFSIPLKSVNEQYIEFINNEYISLSNYYEDEQFLTKDVRLHFFIKEIANLHNLTSFQVNSHDGFFDDSLNFLEDEVDKVNKALLGRIRRVERESYHSPSDWYFLMNYEHYHKALEESKRHIKELEDIWSEGKNLHFSLTYQNFDYRHVIVKQKKIVSLDKMAIAPSIYDLRFLFNNSFSKRYDPTIFLKEYLSIHKLELYEIHWLLAFLFIPQFERKNNEIEEISGLVDVNNYLNLVEKIASFFDEIIEKIQEK